MEMVCWLFLLFVLIYEPIFGCVDFKTFQKKVKTEEKARIHYYVSAIKSLWIPALVIVGLTAVLPLTFKQIGLAPISFNPETLGAGLTAFSMAAVASCTMVLVALIIGSQYNSKLRKKLGKMKKEEISKISYAELLPVSKEEKKIWVLVSLTAGITEEIIYRGFLIFALGYLFPDWSIWAVLFFASLIFGLAHTYQGFSGVVRTAFVGMWLSVAYIGFGSLIPLMILHALIDYFGKE